VYGFVGQPFSKQMYAFVKFYSARAAKKAKERISGKRLLGGQFLKVSFSFSFVAEFSWQ